MPETPMTAIVAGGAGEIGRATVLRLAQAGARVAVLDRDEAGLSAVSRDCPPGSCLPLSVDITDPAAVGRAVSTAVDGVGVPELVVAGVGLLGPFQPAAWEISPEDWSAVIGVNLAGPINLVRAVMPALLGAGRPARIAVIASLMSLIPDGRHVAYTAAKHALLSYAESLRLQLSERSLPIGVTIVCPGPVATAMNAGYREHVGLGTPEGWLTPDEIAEGLLTAVGAGGDYDFSHPGSRAALQRYYDSVLAAAGV